MKNYKESDYARNKYSEGIVYQFADGTVEVTLEDYLRDNPEKTKADFAELKALSDEIYHEQVVLEHRTCRLDFSMDQVAEDELVVASSVEDELVERQESREAFDAACRLLESGELTKVQRRRFFLYYFQGLSTRQIARLEEVHQRAVWDSLVWAEKKLKKFFKG